MSIFHLKLVGKFLLILLLVGACSVDSKQELPEPVVPELLPYGPDNIVRCGLQDKSGNIWFGTWEGVFRYDGKNFERIRSCNNRIYSMLEDRNGVIWFGTVGGGVCRYDGKTFDNLATKDGLSSNTVYDIAQDKAGNIWFATESGACRYGQGKFTTLTKSDGLSENKLCAIHEDRSGVIWMATWNHGLFRYAPWDTTGGRKGSVSNFSSSGVFPLMVREIYEDKKSHLWFGASGGVSRFDGEKLTPFTSFDGMVHGFVGAMCEDSYGNLWLGANGGYLCKYDGKTFKNISFNKTQSNYSVFCVFTDTVGNIWMGTSNGIWRYDGKTFVNFTKNELKQ